jgi:hypothetical protein
MKATRILASLILTASFLLPNAVTSHAASVSSPDVILNGKPVNFEVRPQVISERTYVPFRAILEALGATVTWDSTNNTAHAIKDGIDISIPIGKKEIYVQDHVLAMDVPSQTVNDRALVPLRYVGYALGANVDWNPQTHVVTMTQDAKAMLDQLVNGQTYATDKVTYDRAAILFDWMMKLADKNDLPAFTANRVPDKDPYTGNPMKWAPNFALAPGYYDWAKTLNKLHPYKILNQRLSDQEFYTGIYRVVKLNISTDTGYSCVGYVVADQSKPVGINPWGGYGVVAYVPNIK